VNLRRERIEQADIEEGEEAFSSDLLSNIDFEIRDVAPSAGSVLYEFIGATAVISGSQVRALLTKAVGEGAWEKIFTLLLWYGVLGFVREDGEAAYIYSVKYDMRRLMALVQKKGLDQAALKINPAFWRGLEIRS
jgi:hypothetical protein